MMKTECRWCGYIHGPLCPAVKAIEFDADGVTVRRIEFFGAAPFDAKTVIDGTAIGEALDRARVPR